MAIARHWLLVTNTLLGLILGLPFLTPILLARGHTFLANAIYTAYRYTCHQLPARSYFIFGEQVAFCHRDAAIWASLFAGGLLYAAVRRWLRPLPFKWYLLFLIPMGVDGGTGLISPFFAIFPGLLLVIAALVLTGLIAAALYRQEWLKWQYYLFIAMGPLSFFYVYLFGSHESNWELRTITGAIFGLATMWFVFPLLARDFAQEVTYVSPDSRPTRQTVDV
jgi:uncharacterized membrane protein